MNQETFQIFLWVMSAVALVVFIALYFVKAGYGMFRTCLLYTSPSPRDTR